MIEQLKGYLDIGEWKTLDEIHFYLVNVQKVFTDKRTIRKAFEDYNLRNQKGEIETFIVHSSKGYQLTRNEELIRNSIKDDKKRALKLLKRFYEASKRLGQREQITLNVDGENKQVDLYELVVAFDEH